MRIEEQVALLRQLWTQPLVTFEGRWHTIPDAGLNPLPLQRPIPIWFGGHAEVVLKRAALLGDGWMPDYRRAAEAQPSLERLDHFLNEAGRDKAGFGLEARMPFGDGNPDLWAEIMREWQAAGASHFSFNTMGHGFDTPAKHLQAIQAFAKALGSD
jgi:alkanesulfonate monooxygenase SsuD/methylene tetrahydromethanopterin reductase-like flavin-dependent oxidoreductase (luciferase family)